MPRGSIVATASRTRACVVRRLHRRSCARGSRDLGLPSRVWQRVTRVRADAMTLCYVIVQHGTIEHKSVSGFCGGRTRM
eukprot:6686412-Prymnesium_polylepis.1